MIQHTLENGKTLLFVEVPEDAKVLGLNMLNDCFYYYFDGLPYNIDLPKGNWQLLGDSRKITEEQAMEFMEPICISRSKPNLYVYPDFTDNIKEKNTALEAFKSLKQMLGVVDVNPYPNPFNPQPMCRDCADEDGTCPNRNYASCDCKLAERQWYETQQQVKRYVVLIKID